MKNDSRKNAARDLRIKAVDLIDFNCRVCHREQPLDYCMDFCPVGRALRGIGRELEEKQSRGKRRVGKRLDDRLPPLAPIDPKKVDPAALLELKEKGYTGKTIAEAAGRNKNWFKYMMDKLERQKRGKIS